MGNRLYVRDVQKKEEKRKPGKGKNSKMPTGKVITAVIFLVAIYGMLFGMVKNHKEIGDAFRESYRESSGNVLDKAAAGISSAETTVNKVVVGKKKLIDVFGLFQVMLCRKEVEAGSKENYVYKMDNGQLTFAYPTYKITGIIEQFNGLKKVCDELGTELLYVQWPFKVDKYNNLLPHRKEDDANKNADRLLAGLRQNQIATLDYREVLHERHGSGEAYSSLFFNTDHHWKTETAFEAYTDLVKYLGANYGYEYNPMIVDKNNFIFECVEDCFTGSQANRTGRFYGGVDDFTYVYPAFETDFVWEKYGKTLKKLLTRKGSFRETLFFETVKEDPDIAKPYRDNCYFNGNPALVRITNNNVEKGKILFVCDSYSKPVVSFLSLAIHHLEFMDLRDFTKISLVDYIREQGFEMVIVAYNVSATKKSTAGFFKFGAVVE